MPAVALDPVGFFGKLPARGDFVRRRLPSALVRRWEDWLRQAMSASRAALGNEWLGLYLTAPLWRFAHGGEGAAAGLLMPSIDQVGRHFPLLLALPLPPAVAVETFAVLNEAWYAVLEQTALAALVPHGDLDVFDRAVTDLPPPQWPSDGATGEAVGLWWTNGSPAVPACRRIFPGLPPPSGFAAFLDGRWDRHTGAA